MPELSSLIDPLRSSPALPVGRPFQIATTDAFWTSTRYYPQLYPNARRTVAGTTGAGDGAAFPVRARPGRRLALRLTPAGCSRP